MNDIYKLKGKNILVFDVETTGLPMRKFGFGKKQYWDYKNNKKYDTARIVQISWSYIENYGENDITIDDIYDYIRKPVDFIKIDNSSIHGITYEIAKKKGILLSKIINKKGLGYAIENCDYIVGHNILFDIFILLNECHRLKFKNKISKLNKLLSDDHYVCTGEIGRDICKLPIKNNKYYKYKMPTLSELYCHYLQEPFDNAHNSKFDVLAVCNILTQIKKNSIETNNLHKTQQCKKNVDTCDIVKDNCAEWGRCDGCGKHELSCRCGVGSPWY